MAAERDDVLRIELIEQAFIKVVDDPLKLDRVAADLGLREAEVAHLRGLLDEDQSDPFRSDEPIGLAFDATPGLSGPPELDGYSVYEDLGAGGMGVVYRAIQQSTGQTVAIKVIGRQATSKAWRARFQREIAILGRLRHPGIVQILDAGTTAAGDPYFVMQLVEDGMRIDQWVERERLGWTERLDVFQQVLDAVGYLHHAGVLHRDLKPSNILVDKQGRPKVIDFGISVPETGGEYAATVVAGTPEFMSPESSASRLGVAADTRADIYSLGLILASMFGIRLTGDPDERSKVVRSAIPTPTPRRLQAFQAILARAIAPEPEHRYQSTEAFGVDLDRLVRLQPVEAAGEGFSRRLLLSARRSPGIFGIAALILIILVLVPVLSIDAARQAKLEAERAAKLSNWLESTILGFVENEYRDEVEGAASVWARMNARADDGMGGIGSPDGSSSDLIFEANVLRVRAGALARKGEFSSAIEIYKRAISIMDREMGEDHPASRGCLARLIESAVSSSDRATLEVYGGRLLGDRSITEFVSTEEARRLFSPTLGGSNERPELNASIEFAIQSQAPVAMEALVEQDYASRFAEISALNALGFPSKATERIEIWLTDLVVSGEFDMAYRLAIRTFYLDRSVVEVLDRYQQWCDSPLFELDSEGVIQLALATHIDSVYDLHDATYIPPDCVELQGVAMNVDAMSRSILLDWWEKFSPTPSSSAYLRGFTALCKVTDFLDKSEVFADAMDVDLACWRLLGREIERLRPDEISQEIAQIELRSRNGVDYSEYGRGWFQFANHAVVSTGPWESKPDFLSWRSNLAGTEVQRFSFEEHERLGLKVEVWFGRLCVDLCDRGLCDDDEVVTSNFNLATALLVEDEVPSDEALAFAARAFEEVTVRFGIDSEYALLIGLEYLERLSRASAWGDYRDVRTILVAEYPMLDSLVVDEPAEPNGE